MEKNYSINEILSAVDEIRNKKKEKKSELVKNKSYQKDYTSVPKNTIRLIEEAEKFKN
tara:strand:- start:1830 stop:2003 length:174 start_codon:yes stop_codon:yes gene_type:complete